jgi:hypothetical protein
MVEEVAVSVGRMYHLSWILAGVGFIGGFVLGGQLGSPAIFVVGEALAVVAFCYAMYLSLRVIRAGDPRLLHRGIRGTATVLTAHRTNTVIQAGEFDWMAPWMYKYRLRVTLPGREPYETTCNICADGISEGQEVDIAAAPHNRKRVTIDVGQGKGRSAADASGATPKDRPTAGTSLKFDPSSGHRSSGADPANDDSIGKLERLADLHDRGVLTDDELAEQKRKLLGEGGATS